jgi:hypothetical protein
MPTPTHPGLDATDELFEAFAHRPKPASPTLCVGHCTDMADAELLCRISPRDLDGDLLNHYASNTSFDYELMTHFMPALLRALPGGNTLGEFAVAFGLSARWPDLTDRERAAVDAFCLAWFADTLRRMPDSDRPARHVLWVVGMIGRALDPYLVYWETVGTAEARWHLVDMVLDGPTGTDADTFNRWLLEPAARAMIAECHHDNLTDHDREQLDVATWAIGLR